MEYTRLGSTGLRVSRIALGSRSYGDRQAGRTPGPSARTLPPTPWRSR
ncbi:hypothetical protein [Luteococcus sediminum]